jgi:hypothetical protein
VRFAEIAAKDADYQNELKKIYNGSFIVFIIFFYGLSSIAIYTDIGRSVIQSLATLLPNTLKAQYFLLRSTDDASHLAYIVSLPAVVGVSLFYARQQVKATKLLHRRLAQAGVSFSGSRREPAIIAFLWLILMLVMIFAGTISGGAENSNPGVWLLWPVSGLVSYGVVALSVLLANSFCIAYLFN